MWYPERRVGVPSGQGAPRHRWPFARLIEPVQQRTWLTKWKSSWERRHGPSVESWSDLKQSSCANLANLFTVRQSDLAPYVGTLGAEKMRQVCRALVIACGCD